MAKWGEGDPRWIVEERPDATNVNNWHWTEKNADGWSKKKLEQLLVNLIIEDPKVGNVAIEEMEKCEGEARANNRKAKLIFFYEWEMVLKWKGHVNGKETEVTGKVTIPNLSEEHDDMNDVDIDIEITSGKSSPEAHLLKEMMRKGVGAKTIREKLQNYVDSLKTEYSQNIILPGKNEAKQPVPQSIAAKSAKTTTNSNSVNTSQMKSLAIGSKLEVSDIELEETFKCTGMELFNALTQPEMIQVFTQNPVKMASDAKAGVEFTLLDGSINGTYINVTPYTKISQTWRLKSWPAGHFSEVVMKITQTKEDTKLSLSQKGVPVKELEATRQGWMRYYFHAIKQTFGFGSSLF